MDKIRRADEFDYGVVKASKSVILELGVILRSYFDDLVLIGGWAPYFISQSYQKESFNHVGSIDIDIAVNPQINEKRYGTIIGLIKERSYQAVQDELADVFEFRFERPLISPQLHVKEAFKDIRSNGPAWVANFYNITNERERQIKVADVYKSVSKFLKLLG